MIALTDLLLGLPRLAKGAMAVLVDLVLCVLTVWLAFCLRLDALVPVTGAVKLAAGTAVVMALPLFYLCGLYRSVYRFAGWYALFNVAGALFLFGVLYSTFFTIMGVPGVPRTVGIIQPVLFFLGVGLARSVAGYWLGGVYRARYRRGKRHNVLIYGAGAAGLQLAAAIARSSEFRVVGFADDNASLQGGVMNSVRVYKPSQLPAVIESLEVREVLLALPSISRAQRAQIIQSLIGLDVRVRTLPGLMDIAHGRVHVSDIKPLEIEDLLGREIVAPNNILLTRNIFERTVLVTGAGGSIGSELCRQIVEVGPTILLLVESNEFALYSIHHELTKRLAAEDRLHVSLVPLLASVRDAQRMREIVGAWRPHTIYHAAAYKHVPLVEHNPNEGVWNNVFGTLTTAKVASDCGVSNFVLISTDKAVRPTNIMGTTKRLAEMVLQGMAQQSGSTCFSMVRFGNVLGSSGSVVPLFCQQISDGGPITITHQDITRYFMTIPEAAQLVIQAGAMAKGGEVFVLDMGEPVRIIDLARNMVELAGMTVRDEHEPDGDIEISVVGLRPGEKLYEELLIGDNPEPTSHPRIMKANESHLPWSQMMERLNDLQLALQRTDVSEVLAILRNLVPEYSPEGNVVDWIHLHKVAS